MISELFNASILTSSLLTVSTVASGFGVFVAACVVDVSAVDVPPAVQADKIMDVMNSRLIIFFIEQVS